MGVGNGYLSGRRVEIEGWKKGGREAMGGPLMARSVSKLHLLLLGERGGRG